MQKLLLLLQKMKKKVKKSKDFLTHQIFVGLGNPGTNYAKTRHNAGFWILDELAEHYSETFRKPFFKPYLKASINNSLLIKPLTYMNNSGTILPGLIKKDIDPLIIVITDNMDLEPGRVRLKTKMGTGGGHNGIKSIVNTFGSTPWVITLGIGRPKENESIIDYVLGEPSEPDWVAIHAGIQKVVKGLTLIIQGEVDSGIHAINAP